MPQLFPTSIVQFSTEGLIKRHSAKSRAIYWILIVSIASLIASAFWVKVDVSVNSPGIVTSEELATKIFAPAYGEVAELFVRENCYVAKGDTLVILDTLKLSRNMLLVQKNISLIHKHNTDLKQLCSIAEKSGISGIKTHTEKYIKELKKFSSELCYQKAEIEALEKEYSRQKKLYESNIIPLAEYEQILHQYRNSQLMYNKIFDNQLAQWQNQFFINEEQLLDLQKSLNQLNEELSKYFIVAPANGYIHNITGIKKSGTVYPNQEICTITPTTNLIVETYVSTADIGLIRQEQKVKFRVDAFNFNQWGMLYGNVYEIANDVQMSDTGIPTFKIRCHLDGIQLNYQNRVVNVKKGMTVNANFFLTQRTLAQLVYDKLTDWLDPNEINEEKNEQLQ